MATSELRKALTVAGSGSNLVAADLESAIRNDLLVKSPLINLLPRVKATGNVHTVVKRTAHINAWFEGESTDASYNNSTYARRNVTVKILRTAGKVSDFQQSAGLSFVDSLAKEIQSATDGFRDMTEFAAIWGTADDTGFTGDAYQYSGLYPWVLKDDGNTGSNVFDLGSVIALSDLDAALDATMMKYQNLSGGQWVWLASPQMISKISGLQTAVQRMVPQVEFEGGLVMSTYRNVPFIPNGHMAPTSTSASVAGLGATASGSGTVASGTYRYAISAITLYGEQIGSTAVAVSHGGSSKQTDLAWTANSNAKLYAIFRTVKDAADAVGNYQLLDIVAAKTYDSAGAVSGSVTTYTDDFSKTLQTQVHPFSTNSSMAEETIMLAYLDVDYGASLAVLSPTIGDPIAADPTKDLIRFVPINVTDDSYAFRLKSYHALQMPNGLSCAVLRRVRRK